MQMRGTSHAGPSAPLTIVERLAYRIDEIGMLRPRACIVWLVGQYAADDSQCCHRGRETLGTDVLRKIAKSLRDEHVASAQFTSQSSSANILFFFFSFSLFFFVSRPYP